MNVKAWMPLAVAIVLGLVAAKLVRDRMQKAPPPAPVDKLVPVVVARGPVEIAHALTEADLTVSRVPPETVPSQSFSRPADVVARVTLTQLVKGQTITETLLAPKDTGAGLQALVPPGR
jgi:Flp pilus assembly protein CpaB